MPFKQLVSKVTLNAAEELLRYAKAIPSEIPLAWGFVCLGATLVE